MATRQSIGDPKGERSLYVVQILNGDMWSPMEGGSIDHAGAMRAKRKAEKRNPSDKFRIRLYMPVEG